MTYSDIKRTMTQTRASGLTLTDWCYPEMGEPVAVELWSDRKLKIHMQVDTKLMRYRQADPAGRFGDWIKLG